MKRIKVNNYIEFFIGRFFIIIFLCYLTLLVTGKIADMDFLLGLINYGAGGTSTNMALRIFSIFNFIQNKYLIIIVLSCIGSSTIYLLLRSFFDNKNFNLWKIFLLSPGLLIYTNTPTKETLFLYPAIVFTNLLSKYLTGKKNLLGYFLSFDFYFTLLLLLTMFLLRGDIFFQYLLIYFMCIFFKSIFLIRIPYQFKFNSLTIFSFLISVIVLFFLTNTIPDYFERVSDYLLSSFDYQPNNFRPEINLVFLKNPFNSFQLQYLALFPTPLELIDKPHKILIIIDSLIIIYSFRLAWERLFKTLYPYKNFKQIFLILFLSITTSYFLTYGLIGSYNLGSSQRLRINFMPIGIIFPVMIEKRIRDKASKNSVLINN